MDNTSKVWDVNRYKRKPIASFSNDVGDGNENVKKVIGACIKQNKHFARASHFCLYFSLLSLHDYFVKYLISRFTEAVNKQR